MNGTGYKILGFAVWQGGKWYLRKRLPSSRALAVSVLSALAAVGGAAILARRLAA
ncbi:MAG TPA: hypothetical protein VII01_12540 [Solirubrobacteraceae bacterium]|jgi:hypothetical protein